MANPGELEFVIKANSDDFTKGIKAASEQTNRLTRQMDRAGKMGGWQRQQIAIARDARKAAFDRLSIEDKSVRLAEKRLRLEQMISRAQQGGNAFRLQALRTSLAAVRSQQSGLAGGLASHRSGVLSDMLGYAGLGWASRAVSWIGGRLPLGLLAGGAGAAGLGGLIFSQARTALGLERASQQSGLTVNQIRVGRAFSAAHGYEGDSALPLIERTRQAQGDALRGSTEMTAAFRALGISGSELQRSLPADLFLKIASLLGSGASNAVAFAAANRVLGESFRAVSPLLRQGLGAAIANAPAGISGSQAILAGVGRDLAGAWAGTRSTAGRWSAGIAGTAAAFGYRMSGGGAAGLGAMARVLGLRGASNWLYGYSDAAAERVLQYTDGGDLGAGAAANADERLAQALAARQERQRAASEIEKENQKKQEQLNLERMAPGEQRLELVRRRMRLRRLMESERDPVKLAELRAQSMEVESGILSMRGTPTSLSMPAGDSLAKIGLFRGGFDPANAIRVRQLEVLQRMERLNQRIESNTRSMNTHSQPQTPLME